MTNTLDKYFSFNPLNQVYVFNSRYGYELLFRSAPGFNPLNQVYVFNLRRENQRTSFIYRNDGFNPLNQVYVFNVKQLT